MVNRLRGALAGDGNPNLRDVDGELLTRTPMSVTAPESPTSSTRLNSLDALRGTAAIVILLYHSEQLHGVRGTFSFGYLAVDFFFLLSGFVLVAPFEKHAIGQQRSNLAVLAARFLRFWPLMALGALIGAGVESLRWPAEQVLPLLAFALLSLPLAWGSGNAFALNGPQWSLFVELVCNSLHVVFLRHWSVPGLLVLSLSCGIALTWGQENWNALASGTGYHSISTGLLRAGFAYPLGIVMGRKQHLLRSLPQTAGWAAPALLIATFVLPAILGFSEAFAESFARGGFVIVLVVGVRCSVQLTDVRTMSWLGAISFPLYAIHSPVLEFADMAGRAAPSAFAPVIFLGGVVIALVLAHVLSRTWLARGIRLPAPKAKNAQEPSLSAQSG